MPNTVPYSIITEKRKAIKPNQVQFMLRHDYLVDHFHFLQSRDNNIITIMTIIVAPSHQLLSSD